MIEWNRLTSGNIFKSEEILESSMDHPQTQIQEQGLSENLLSQEKLLTENLDIVCRQKEIHWKQKSRVKWLEGG